ncbi:MAG: paraslipin [Chromatiales bacterium 21-64-14]|nr:MAG: paraslipin [Chromatiales bacterium 21-64-14]HQU16787.1 SPFH domain-containing protein [Gammaproteobacteria bacterium]
MDLLIVLAVLAVVALLIAGAGIKTVPQQHALVVERMGRFHKVLGPGLNVLIPVMDRVAYAFDLRETPIDVQKQVCITKDNTQIAIDGVLYLQITDPKAAAYGTSNPTASMIQLAQTVMRSDVGQRNLDEVLSSRVALNAAVVSELDKAATTWGLKVLRYEIRDITPPEDVIRAMELQITAEREKRARVATSEGERQQAINVSEGARQGAINQAQGEQQARVLRAEGEAKAILVVAEATAQSLQMVGKALEAAGARDAMQMQVAESFIAQWGGIAKQANVMIVPADMGDIAKTVGTAFRIVEGVKSATGGSVPK